MTTEVTIKLDQLTLQVLKMGLASLRINVELADALLTEQVNAALAAAAVKARDTPPDVPEKHHRKRTPQ